MAQQLDLTLDEMLFRQKVDKALGQIQSILDTTRHPRLIDGCAHEHVYEDKFLLAETLTNTSVAVYQTILSRLFSATDNKATNKIWQDLLTSVQSDHRTVTLRFQAADSCTLLKENVVEVLDPTSTETSTTTKTTATTGWMSSSSTNTTTRVTRKIKEMHWQIRTSYTLSIFAGTDSPTELAQREASTIVVIGAGNSTGTGRDSVPAPIPPSTQHPAMDVHLTWLLQQLKPGENPNDDESFNSATTPTTQFAIDRQAAKTPRRNDQVDQALQFHASFLTWAELVVNHFTQRVETTILGQHKPVLQESVSTLMPGTVCTLQNITKEPKFNGKQVVVKEYVSAQERYRVEPLNASDGLPASLLVKVKDLFKDVHAGNASSVKELSPDQVFCPVQPLVEEGTKGIWKDLDALLQAHDKALDDLLTQQSKIYSPKQVQTKLLSVAEATMVLLCRHAANVATHYRGCILYLEQMLMQQLVQAIGKQVTPADFTNFMRFYARQRLFGPVYAPKPFSYAIRQAGHAPEGMLSVECLDDSSTMAQPIETMVRHLPPDQLSSPLQIPLSAATTVPMTGDWYLHGWLMHQFGTNENGIGFSAPSSFSSCFPMGGMVQYTLTARARQFSSILLVIGTMAGPHRLDPKHAILLQNKDDLLIPLLTEVLPSAQDFKDAIASLSPEQQDFCKAFRSMQLQSSVFGVAVIQLKPQLEKLLRLAPGSLTKEIQLTQDLMNLFMEYQIPSDLLSFDGSEEASKADRLAAVKEHVKNVLQVITSEKEKTILAEEQKADFRDARMGPVLATSALMMAESDGDSFSFGGAVPKNYSVASSAPRPGKKMSKAKVPFRSRVSDETVAPPPSLPEIAAAASPALPVETTTTAAAATTTSPATTTTSLGAPFASKTAPAEDFTLLPQELDMKLEKLDTDNALRSTVLKVGDTWTLQRQENLLTPSKEIILSPDDIVKEKKKAFDLLDAMSRSGALPIESAELHVIFALSHCFEKDLMGTVLQDNVNPIAKVEKSALLLASTVHRVAPATLVASQEDAQRLAAAFPLLFDKEA